MCRGLHVQGLTLPTGRGPLLNIRIKAAHMFHTVPLPSPCASMPFGEQLQSLRSWKKSGTGQAKKQSSIKHQAGWRVRERRVRESTCVRSMTCPATAFCPLKDAEHAKSHPPSQRIHHWSTTVSSLMAIDSLPCSSTLILIRLRVLYFQW